MFHWPPWPNRHNSLHGEHIPHILFLSRVANSKYPGSTFQSHGPMVVNGLKKMVPGFPKMPLGARHDNDKGLYIPSSLGMNSLMFANCSVFCDVWHVRSSVLGQNVVFGSVRSSVLLLCDQTSLGTYSLMSTNYSVFCVVWHVRSSILGQNVMFRKFNVQTFNVRSVRSSVFWCSFQD